MSDVNTFIDAIGKDVSAVTAPKLDALGASINASVQSEYGPRVSAFVHGLVKDIVDEQSANVRDLATSLIQELCHRYRPEILGDVHARIVQGGLDLTGNNVRLDLKRQDNGAVVASLDIPISIHINVADLAVKVQDATIRLDVLK